MPSAGERKADTFSIIQLWDPNKNKITVESTKQVTTQTIQTVKNTRIRTGQGSAATSEFNFNETRAFSFTLSAPFDGYFDTDGRLQGTTSFQVLDDTGVAFTPVNAESLVVTLDGVLQEPGVAYTVSGDNIIFSAPPLGPGNKLTGITRADRGTTATTHSNGATVTNTSSWTGWGSAAANTDSVTDPGLWSLDNLGSTLIALIHNGECFQWDGDALNATSTRATIITGAPTASRDMLVSTPDRHLVFFGTETTIGDKTTQDDICLLYTSPSPRD